MSMRKIIESRNEKIAQGEQKKENETDFFFVLFSVFCFHLDLSLFVPFLSRSHSQSLSLVSLSVSSVSSLSNSIFQFFNLNFILNFI